MSRFGAVLLVAASLVASACTDGEAGREWGDATGMTSPVVSNATELVATNDYRLLVGDAPAEGSGRCVQLVIGSVGLSCFEVGRESGAGSWSSISLGIEGQRIVWFRSSVIEPVADHLVVWSSIDRDGRRVEPIHESGTTHLVLAMRPGEEPWGIQWIDEDGFLLRTDSLVGLPGD